MDSQSQTVLLLIPEGLSDNPFIETLRTQLKSAFGTHLRFDVRIDKECIGRCRYRLSGEWGRPTEVYDTLARLFSAFQGESSDECTLP